jgi:peptide/nickel transport system substrate-binding protein
MNGAYLEQAADGKVSDNFGRYNNPEATALLKKYAQASDDATAPTRSTRSRRSSSRTSRPSRSERTRPGRVQHAHLHGMAERDDQYATADPTQPSAVQVIMNLNRPSRTHDRIRAGRTAPHRVRPLEHESTR